MNNAVDADTAPLRRRCRFACIVAALAAGALIAAVPHRARAQDAQDNASEDQCRAAVQNAPQPPFALPPFLLRVLQPSIEPVPATDGLIHLAYMAQLTNLFPAGSSSIGIVEAGAADPTANYAPTGRNIALDHKDQDVTGQILPIGQQLPPGVFDPKFVTSLPASNAGWMLFDVTYTDPAQVPPVLANAITYTDAGHPLPGVPALTEPVPVGCVPLAVLHPPWSGMAGMPKAAAAPTRFTTARWQITRTASYGRRSNSRSTSCCWGRTRPSLNPADRPWT